MLTDDTMRAALLYKALEDAVDGLTEMLPYIDDYFVNKWKLGSYVDRAQHALNLARAEGNQ